MCDYSLHHVRSRPAKVGDKLTTRDFGLGTVGFAASEDDSVAVCVLPGAELSFAEEVTSWLNRYDWCERVFNHKTAIFRQVNQEKKWAHRDALEFPDGEIVMLTYLQEGQHATVLQLPASAGVAEQRTEPSNASKASLSRELIAT
jgi:hypothetical protein